MFNSGGKESISFRLPWLYFFLKPSSVAFHRLVERLLKQRIRTLEHDIPKKSLGC